MESSSNWGKYLKSIDYKLEKTTYKFHIIYDPNYSNSIVLTSARPTQRDGGKFDNVSSSYSFNYSFRKIESLIDNPPN